MKDRNGTDLSVLELNVRSLHILRRRGYVCVEHLTRMTRREFMKEFGRKTLKDVEDSFEWSGHKFKRRRSIGSADDMMDAASMMFGPSPDSDE